MGTSGRIIAVLAAVMGLLMVGTNGSVGAQAEGGGNTVAAIFPGAPSPGGALALDEITEFSPEGG